MSQVWFTSDHHFGHKKVSEYRNFPTVAHHDMAILERHNDLVKPGDLVFMLGDLSMTRPDRGAFDWIDRMNGRKRLIAGNHDPVHPMHSDAHKWQRDYLTHFESVAPFGRASINGTKVMLSHFPYEVDRGEARYTEWRLSNVGEWLIHGHLHTSLTVTSWREIHVGLDAWDLKPVSADQIQPLMERMTF